MWTAGCFSDWAEPRCSTIRRTPSSLTAICTAVAPEVVLATHKRAHTNTPYGHLVHHHQVPTPQYQRKLMPISQ